MRKNYSQLFVSINQDLCQIPNLVILLIVYKLIQVT